MTHDPTAALDLISTPAALQALADNLAGAGRVGLDTEADSLHVYREKLCLIQLGLPDGRQELVDPLAELSLAPLLDSLRPKQLVLHGADYDLRLLRRAGDFVAASAFDTMLGARLVGRREFSYAALVRAECGVELTKGSQKADWGRRPLTAKMLEYARNDTRYLLALAERIEERLRSLGRWEWFEQSCARVVAQASVERERNEEEAWRVSGSGGLRGRTAAYLRELWRWREAEARNADRPAFHVLRNEDLITLARQLDAGQPLPSFKHLRGPRLRRLEENVARARELPAAEWPEWKRPRGNGRPTPEEEKRAEELKARRDRQAAELDLEASMIAARAALEAIAARPETAPEWLLPWQRGLLGV